MFVEKLLLFNITAPIAARQWPLKCRAEQCRAIAIALQFHSKKNDNEKCFDKLSKIEAEKCVQRVCYSLSLLLLSLYICVCVSVCGWLIVDGKLSSKRTSYRFIF